MIISAAINARYALVIVTYSLLLFMFGGYIRLIEFRELCVNFICKELNNLEPVYDYVIVGCGSAGSVVALRLAEDQHATVLVLEAGPHGTSWFDIPAVGPLLQLSSVDWQYRTVPQTFAAKGLQENVSNWPMGRIVGGSGRLNNMIYIRGHPSDFDEWYKDVEDYSFERDILSYFKKSEDHRGSYKADTQFHSIHGPLVVEDLSFVTSLSSIFLEAVQTLGYSVGDLNGKYNTGFMQAQVNIGLGSRWTPARHLLNRQKQNLVLQTNTYVQKILLRDNYEAYGVKYSHLGERRMVHARKGVIISAGVIGTPKLLMLSGIGPSKHLADVGIKLKIDLPVGDNLRDHVTTGADLVLLNTSLGINPVSMLSPKAVFDYFYNSTGPWTGVGCEVVGMVDTNSENYCFEEENSLISHRNISTLASGKPYSFAKGLCPPDEHRQPDLGFMVIPIGAATDSGKHLRRAGGISDKTWSNYFAPLAEENPITILPIVLHPKSRGTVRLSDKSPDSYPLINPNYLSDPFDVKMLRKGIDIIKEIVATEPMQALGAKLNDRLFPGCEHLTFDTEPYWECYIRHLTVSSWHPCGTCKMGSSNDAQAVVGYDFRVHGTNNLYVVDASVMPTSLSGNLNAAVVMLGEKAADQIKHHNFLNCGNCVRKEVFVPKQIC